MVSTLYKCDKCGSYHASKEFAEECENRVPRPCGLKVGDVIIYHGEPHIVLELNRGNHFERPVVKKLGGRKKFRINSWQTISKTTEQAYLKYLRKKYPENVRKIN